MGGLFWQALSPLSHSYNHRSVSFQRLGRMDASLVAEGLPTPWVGLKERIFWFAYQLWFMVLTFTLLRQRTGDGESR